MLLLGEQDVDDLVAGAPIHTDDRPILEFSDMDRYMTEDVAPNLERLLDHQREDLGRYFSGTPGEVATLERHLEKYNDLYRDYVERYKRELGRRDR